MSFDYIEYTSSNEKKISEVGLLWGKAKDALQSFDIDSFVEKKGVLKKREYLSVYDAYYTYFKVCMNLTPIVMELEKSVLDIQESMNELSETEKNLEERRTYLENKLLETNTYLKEMEESEEVTVLDITEKTRLEHLRNDVMIQIQLLNQEEIQRVLIQDINTEVFHAVNNIINHTIPFWKKQVKISIDLMVEYNQNKMDSKLQVSDTVKQEILKIKDVSKIEDIPNI